MIELPEIPVEPPLEVVSAGTLEDSQPLAEKPLEEVILSAEEQQRLRVVELEALRAELQQQLADVQQRRYALMREEARLSQDIDQQTIEIDRLSAPQSTTENIQAYIAQQKKDREAKAVRMTQLIEAGVSSDELRPIAAAIDAKLAGRRPTDRPKLAVA